MIKEIDTSQLRVWHFCDHDEPVALIIYAPITHCDFYHLIVEEPTEGGPSFTTYDLPKQLVSAAFCLDPEDAGHPDVSMSMRNFRCYDIPIHQIIWDWKTDRYCIGSLTKSNNGTHIMEPLDDRRFVLRSNAVLEYFSDKSIHSLIWKIQNTPISQK